MSTREVCVSADRLGIRNARTAASVIGEWSMRCQYVASFEQDNLWIRIGILPESSIQNQEPFKGQACLRSSPLGKRYGWGVHSDAEGRVAVYPIESAAYKKLLKDKALATVKAMRSKRK